MTINIKNSLARKHGNISTWAATVVTSALLLAGTAGRAQPTADVGAQNLQEIVKFTQAHMTDDVIVSYIKCSGKTYSLNGDALLYLNSQGVSQTVLSAMLAATPSAGSGLAPAPETNMQSRIMPRKLMPLLLPRLPLTNRLRPARSRHPPSPRWAAPTRLHLLPGDKNQFHGTLCCYAALKAKGREFSVVRAFLE
jgi:hypothetical protein